MRKYHLPYFFLLAAALGGALLSLPANGFAKITLTDPSSDRVILTTVIGEGEEASYSWTNSIFRIPVREIFILQDGNLTLRKIYSGDVNESAVTSVSAEEVEDLYHPGDEFFTDKMNRSFQQIAFRVGEIGRPYFKVGNKEVDFKQEVGFGGKIILDVQPIRVYELLLSRLGLP